VSATTPSSEGDEGNAADIASAISEIFGERAPLAVRYSELLVSDGIERGLLGPREADRVWQRHILNCAVVAPLIPAGSRVVDVGSGAGLPGIPLAIARPDLDLVLLEPMQRRVRFLRDVMAVLALPNVSVQSGRAEAGLTPLADVVVARAIAPLADLVRLSFGLLSDGGILLAIKGASAADELQAANLEAGLNAELIVLPAPGQAATVIRVTRPARPQQAPTTRRARRGSR
jgi:16S rRNA (guanine527-N7)-methyltransferase